MKFLKMSDALRLSQGEDMMLQRVTLSYKADVVQLSLCIDDMIQKKCEVG